MSDATNPRRCAFPHSLPSTFSNDEFFRLAAALQEAAEALLLFCRPLSADEESEGGIGGLCDMAEELNHADDRAGEIYDPNATPGATDYETDCMSNRAEESECSPGMTDEGEYANDTASETGCAGDTSKDTDEGKSQKAHEQAGADEYRRYRLASHIIREEQQLLERYEADSLAQALHEIHADLHTTVYLMRGFEEGDDDRNFHIHLIGEQLARSLDMLSMACSIMADYDLVDVTDAPRQ